MFPLLSRFLKIVIFSIPTFAALAESGNIGTPAVLIDNVPNINGRVEGNLQFNKSGSFNLNSGGKIIGDLLIPGSPSIQFNGNSEIGMTVEGNGSPSPEGYYIRLNSGSQLDALVTRTDPVELSTVVSPHFPSGNRSINANSPGADLGDFQTLKNLNLNSNAGDYEIPEGAYGNFSINGGSSIVLGEAGSLEAKTYHFQRLTLNGSGRIQILGPVVINLKNGLSTNGSIGDESHTDWLSLNIKNGGFNLNSSGRFYGNLKTPNGHVNINGNARLEGSLEASRLNLNSNGVIVGSLSLFPAENSIPVALGQELQTDEDQSISILLEGSDLDGDSLAYTITSQPQYGSLSGVPPHVSYSPASNLFGEDYFTFSVNDGDLESEPSQVSISVEAVNDPPEAIPESYLLAEDEVFSMSLLGDDIEDDTLQFQILTLPSNGSLVLLESQDPVLSPNYNYVPNANYHGTDAFTYRVFDGELYSEEVATLLEISSVNDMPVAYADNFETAEDTDFSGTLTGIDDDGDILTFGLETQALNGVVSIDSSGGFVYTPNLNYNGPDSFTFIVSDGSASSTPSLVGIAVSPINDAPVLPEVGAVITLEENSRELVGLPAVDADLDEISLILISNLRKGVISGSSEGYEYIPSEGAFGREIVEYYLSDGELDSDPGYFIINIEPVNSDPVETQTISANDRIHYSNVVGADFEFKDIYYNQTFDTWTLAWQGGGLGGLNDSLHFVDTALSDNIQLSARLDFISVESERLSAGLMLRADDSSDSAFVSIAFTNDEKMVVGSRYSAGLEAEYEEIDWVPLPEHIRLVRRGDQVRAFVSEDGQQWRLVQQREVQLPLNYQGGQFLEGGESSTIAIAEFGSLFINEIPEGHFRANYQVSDFGNLVSYSDVLELESDSSFSVTSLGGSSDWPLEDGTLAYVEVDGDFELSAKLVDLKEGGSASSAGLLLRDGLDADAPFAAVHLNRTGQLVFSSRQLSTDPVISSVLGTEYTPLYLRLAHIGDSVRADYSSDGVDWTAAGSVDLNTDSYQRSIVGLFAAGLEVQTPVEALFESVEFLDTFPPPLDSDGDGMPDVYESANGLNPNDPSDAESDLDNDGLNNLREFTLGTNPQNPDTDGDALPDGWEVSFGLDPSNYDADGDIDGDGLSNGEEYLGGSSPTDYYNGVPVSIVSLSDPMGNLGSQKELSVRILDTNDLPMENAPVEFFPILGEHGVSSEPDGLGEKSVVVRSDAQGIARAYLRPLSHD